MDGRIPFPDNFFQGAVQQVPGEQALAGEAFDMSALPLAAGGVPQFDAVVALRGAAGAGVDDLPVAMVVTCPVTAECSSILTISMVAKPLQVDVVHVAEDASLGNGSLLRWVERLQGRQPGGNLPLGLLRGVGLGRPEAGFQIVESIIEGVVHS